MEERRKILAAIVKTKGIISKGPDDHSKQSADETRKDAIIRGHDEQVYADALRDLETDQELLQQLKVKQMGETISLKIPVESVVIHDEPVLAERPVSPNVALNLTLGTVLGLLLSPLLALPLMFLCHRLMPSSNGV